MDNWVESTKLEKDVSPGPGEYQLPSTLVVPGGTWGKYMPMTDLERAINEASKIPGPGQYKVERPIPIEGKMATQLGQLVQYEI